MKEIIQKRICYAVKPNRSGMNIHEETQLQGYIQVKITARDEHEQEAKSKLTGTTESSNNMYRSVNIINLRLNNHFKIV